MTAIGIDRQPSLFYHNNTSYPIVLYVSGLLYIKYDSWADKFVDIKRVSFSFDIWIREL